MPSLTKYISEGAEGGAAGRGLRPMTLTARVWVEAARKRPGSARKRTPEGKCAWRARRRGAAIAAKERAGVSTPGKPPPTSRRSIGAPRERAAEKTSAARATASTKARGEVQPEPTWKETPRTRTPRRCASRRRARASARGAPYLHDMTQAAEESSTAMRRSASAWGRRAACLCSSAEESKTERPTPWRAAKRRWEACLHGLA
mmetsp:Transcript_48203/g.119370  ORF Transcript_48203/g.119370 Transcript_48203/m.119370 type:complete len:203 (+) Transcript_48203:811-1419(+)